MILLGAMVFVSACDKTREEQIRPVAVYALAEHDAVFTAKFPSIVEAGNEAVLSLKSQVRFWNFRMKQGRMFKKGKCLSGSMKGIMPFSLKQAKKKCWRRKMRIWG